MERTRALGYGAQVNIVATTSRYLLMMNNHAGPLRLLLGHIVDISRRKVRAYSYAVRAARP